MHIENRSTALPADVKAAIIPVSLLGERYVQFSPVYTGGARLHAGALLPVSRTQVPVEIDELLRGLKDFFGGIKPENAHDLVSNLAMVIDGEGLQLNQLIHNAAGTLQILADKGNDLGQLVDSLAKLTTTLRSHTDAISQLVRNYDTVSGVLAQNRGALDETVTQLRVRPPSWPTSSPGTRIRSSRTSVCSPLPAAPSTATSTASTSCSARR